MGLGNPRNGDGMKTWEEWMKDGRRDHCIVCDKKLHYKPEYCCGGFECGCYGLPIEPPVCSNKCCDKFMNPAT